MKACLPNNEHLLLNISSLATAGIMGTKVSGKCKVRFRLSTYFNSIRQVKFLEVFLGYPIIYSEVSIQEPDILFVKFFPFHFLFFP
jgi:hypothetical protein